MKQNKQIFSLLFVINSDNNCFFCSVTVFYFPQLQIVCHKENKNRTPRWWWWYSPTFICNKNLFTMKLKHFMVKLNDSGWWWVCNGECLNVCGFCICMWMLKCLVLPTLEIQLVLNKLFISVSVSVYVCVSMSCFVFMPP